VFRHGLHIQDTNLMEVASSRKRGCYPTVFDTLESWYTKEGLFFFG